MATGPTDAYLKAWLAVLAKQNSPIVEGAIFRRLDRWGNVGRSEISGKAVNDIFEARRETRRDRRQGNLHPLIAIGLPHGNEPSGRVDRSGDAPFEAPFRADRGPLLSGLGAVEWRGCETNGLSENQIMGANSSRIFAFARSA